MIGLNEIEKFLGDEGLLVRGIGAHQNGDSIRNVVPSDSAGPGELSWISEKHLKRHPNAWESFAGAALIVPESWSSARELPFRVFRTTKPKLALVRVLNQFFAGLSEISFPKLGESPVSHDARLAADAVLCSGVVIGPEVEIGAGAVIGPNSVLAYCSVGAHTRIGANCSIGLPGFGYEKDESGEYLRFPHVGRVVIGSRVEIGSNTCIDRGSLGNTVLEDACKIDNLVHIAHNVRVGKHTLVIANAMIGGSTTIGERAWIAPSAALMNQIQIGADAVVGLGAVVLKNVAPAATVVGNPAKPLQR